MNTDNYRAWQALLKQRDLALYAMLALAALLIGSYLLTYVSWIPARYGRMIRIAYEIGGVLLYIGIVYISNK